MPVRNRRIAQKTGGKPVRKGLKRQVASLSSGSDSPRVASLRENLGLNRKMFSRLSGYSERAIAEWEGGKPLSVASRQRMMELVRLQRALGSVIKADFLPQWLQTPNDAFQGLKPLEVIERGEVDRIWRMVYQLESGVPR